MADYELIFHMNDPLIGAYNLWDAVFHKPGQRIRFRSGLTVDAEYTLAVGEVVDVKDKMEAPLLQFVMFDKRGRTVWEKTQAVAGLAAVKKMLAHPDGFIVVADRAMGDIPDDVWIGVFDTNANLKHEQIIDDPNGPATAHDIIPGFAPGEFVLAASFRSPNTEMAHSLLVNLDAQGEVIWRRAYMPGIDNKVFGLHMMGEGKLAAAGYIQSSGGRRSGWIMVLTDKGAIEWQLQYPRGRAAQFYKIAPFKTSYLAAAGTAYPLGSGPQGGWVMMVDVLNGTILWQRYYTGTMDLEARDFLVHDSGLLSVMLTGENARSDKDAVDRPFTAADDPLLKPPPPSEALDSDQKYERQDFVRLMTLNARGVLLSSEEFFNGDGAQAYQLVPGKNGERMIFGTTQIGIETPPPKTAAGKDGKDAKPPEPKIVQAQAGWAVAGNQVDTYNDPCVRPKAAMPRE